MYQKRAEAIINLTNIRHNYRTIKNITGNAKIICVVKADAYGHGAAEVCRTLSEEGANFFAVACIDEGIVLRESGIKGDILILGVTYPREAYLLHRYDFIQTVTSEDYAVELDKQGYSQRIHIKIDSGMSRLGIYCHNDNDILKTVSRIKKITELKNLSAEGFFTHFACSDNISSSMTIRQYKIFEKIYSACINEGINVGMRHCCNSGGIINYPEMHLDGVRAGLLLYGLTPCKSDKLDLLTAMELVSRIAQISKLNKGDTVSYTAGYTAEKAMTAAVISIGYADGFSRLLSEKAEVYINGKPAKIIGKICMDLCVADITDLECTEGDLVEVFGKNQSVDILANLMNTVNYEIICSVKNRVSRRYIK